MGSLTSTQNAILTGTLLGDGSLRRQGNRLNALLEVNHSVEYREYVDWKWQHFKKYVITSPHSRKNNSYRIAYRFTTRSLPVFTEYYNKYYINSKKRVPRDIKLNPLSLAVWFMDDGTRIRSAFYLNTQHFTLQDQEFLQDLLFNTFGFNSTLNRDKKYFRIRIFSKSSLDMQRLIKPYIIPCMKYKMLTNDPVTTELKNEILV